MGSGHKLPVFVSSAHYGLEDLRAELAGFLGNLGVAPYVSSEAGFPDSPGVPPYVGCLRVLESCPLVVGIIDRRYGSAFEDWGPYPQYKGLSPTHGELRHAVAMSRRLIIYVRSDVQSFYEMYRKNKGAFENLDLPANLDVKTLEMYEEIKKLSPAPWIEPFHSVHDLKISLQQRLLNELYELMLQREATTSAAVETLKDAFLRSEPSLREAVLDSVDAAATERIAELDVRIGEIAAKEERLRDQREEANRAADDLRTLRRTLDDERTRMKVAISSSVVSALASALASGVRPVALRRRAGQDSLPLVTDQELATGGFHFSGYSQSTPVVTKVTWSRLPRRDPQGIGRGYDAGLQVYGSDFAPGCRIESRQRGEESRHGEGHVPNIYSGHYLELSTTDSLESPIGRLDWEYRVANPHPGRTSEWVSFTYEYDEGREIAKAEELLTTGEKYMQAGEHEHATEPLRGAHVRLAGLVGRKDERWARAHGLWRESLYARGTWKRPSKPGESKAT